MSNTLSPSGSYESDLKSPDLDQAPESTLPHGEESADLEALKKKAKLSDYFAIACSGAALVSDGLQNNCMTMANVIFAQLYGKAYTSDISTRISNSLTVGTILGQVSIGIVCDLLGRKHGIVISTVCIILGIIMATASHGAHGSFIGWTWCMTVARGLTGIGVGGEYPSSSVSAVEGANEKMAKNRGGVFIMVTNFVLSFGGPLASILYLIVLEAAGGDNAKLYTVWRVVFGITVIPPVAVFFFRIRMLNSKLYRKSAIQKGVPLKYILGYYWKSLIGTAGAWFLYDFVTFPNGVFSGTIISNIIDPSLTGPAKVRSTAEWQLLLGALSLPGCIIGALIVNRLGRRNLMIAGFAGYLVIGLIVGCAYEKLITKTAGFVVLYGLMQSFGNLGPGNTMGLTSAESYATAVRASCYGFSAAVGKVGAVIGTESFTPIKTNLGPRYTFIVAACCGLVGIIVAFFFIRNDLGGDLADEDRKFATYLQSKGWNGQMGVRGVEAQIDDDGESAKYGKGEVKQVE
ncbi:hypothetical protein JCM8097_000089 [Rhodosporidiobolus ruineniae]